VARGTTKKPRSQTKAENEIARRRRTVRNFPAASFQEALEFAKEIWKFGSGQAARRLSLFDHLGKSPDSSASRMAITNAGKYGLIKGSYAAEYLEITSEGILAIDEEVPPRDQARARVSLAILGIEPFKGLYERFVGNKLPAKAAMVDAVTAFGVAKGAAEEAVDTFIVNSRYVGLLATLSGADRFVTVEHLLDTLPSSSSREGDNSRSAVAGMVSGGQNQLITGEHAQFETTCFYIAPIGEVASEQRKHSDLFLGSLVEPAIEQFKLKLVRADAIDKPGIITRQIIEYIVRSRLVIVDLSFHNPNVFYELALRHMMRLPIVQIARTADRIPFDISQMRTVIIDTTDIYSLVPKLEVYRAEISNQVRRALDDSEAADTPISTYFPNLRATLN
jgi:hypothetical protein